MTELRYKVIGKAPTTDKMKLMRIRDCCLMILMFSSCSQVANNREERTKAAKYDSIMNSLQSVEDSSLGQETGIASSIYDDCIASVVTVKTDNGFLGSGFFVSPNIVATCYHVIKGCYFATIKSSITHEESDVDGFVAVDLHNDLILLQCRTARSKPLEISNSLPRIGESIFVIGSPLGLDATLSVGSVSGLRSTEVRNLIQITAPISHGSSGGPVLNEKKKVVGIAEMNLVLGQNLNFAIPSQALMYLMSYMEPYSSPLWDLSSIDPGYFDSSPQVQGRTHEDSSVNKVYPIPKVTSPESNSTYKVIWGTNLYPNPDGSGEPIIHVHSNSYVQVIDKNVGDRKYWYVDYNGYTGYILRTAFDED